ncbi:MAG: hypothetical protein ACYCY8_10130 [Burkholderiales bacterium]
MFHLIGLGFASLRLNVDNLCKPFSGKNEMIALDPQLEILAIEEVRQIRECDVLIG